MKRRPFHGDKSRPPRLQWSWPSAAQVWMIVLSFTALMLVAANLWYAPGQQQRPEPEVEPQISAETRVRILDQVQQVLHEYLIQEDWQRDQGDHIEVLIPRKLDFFKMYGAIDKQVSGRQITTVCKETGDANYMLDVKIKDQNVCRFLFVRQQPLGYVAIIIDDFGYVYNDLSSEFMRLRFPITVSIIPGLQASRTAAREASLSGKEVLVHMPMQPQNAAYDDNGYLLKPGQTNSTVRMRMRQAFSQLPNAVGMNNHQGSLATTDPVLMRIVLGELKINDKIFIDSFTTPQTVGYKMARQLGVKAAVNKLFIDAKYEESFMLDQFDRITEMALSGQHVVAIGHVRRKTLDVLQRKIPELDQKGVEFVSVSKLVN